MATYTVADAKNRLPELISRALKGEGVVITRGGRPVAELRPVSDSVRRVSAADLDWLADHRVGRAPPEQDAGVLLQELRDESEQ